MCLIVSELDKIYSFNLSIYLEESGLLDTRPDEFIFSFFGVLLSL